MGLGGSGKEKPVTGVDEKVTVGAEPNTLLGSAFVGPVEVEEEGTAEEEVVDAAPNRDG